jgi:hypothetical protein
METVLHLFESTSLKNTIKSQFKKIKKSDVTVDTVITVLSDRLKEKYAITQTNYEIIVRVDKRKNLEQVKTEVQSVLDEVEVSFDMKYLFKVMSGQNEIIVRARRKR